MLYSCGTTGSEIPYVQNIDEIPPAALATVASQSGDFTIKPGDLLQINVSASNSESVAPFNKIQYVPTLGSGYGLNYGAMSSIFYLVDDNGNIDFPVLGRLHIKGMTKRALEDYVASLIYPRYLNENPGVECRIQNFRVYCLGEFAHPGVIQAENGRLNMIEAIAMCGDLTLQGRRDNVLLIRTDPMNQSNTLYVAKNSDLAMWTFHAIENDLYYLTVNGQYLRIDANGSLTLADEPDEKCQIRVIPGTGSNAGKVCLLGKTTHSSISLADNNTSFSTNANTTSSNAWQNLVEYSVYSEDDFVQYSAHKVSVSDSVNVANGKQVIIYTRVWNETEKKYEFFAIDHNGDVLPCYESGDSLLWIGTQINTLLWNFTEYYRPGTTVPNGYYELQNAYEEVASFWETLLNNLDAFQDYIQLTRQDKTISSMRENNLLLKPVTQMALAHVARMAKQKELPWVEIVDKLNRISWSFDNELWFNLLVIGSANKKMITGKEAVRGVGMVIAYLVMGDKMTKAEIEDVKTIYGNAKNNADEPLPPMV